jgi:hypothetical protein
MIDELRELHRTADSYALAERIQSAGGDAKAVAERYAELLRDVYWKAKDVSLAVAVGRAGILFALTKAAESESVKETEAATTLRGLAKQMAYNVASFAWPGWGEPGLTVTDADRQAGHDAARLNLRLAVELKREASKVAAAHWLRGAHELTANDPAGAAESFRRARDDANRAGEVIMALDYEAFDALAACVASPQNAAARETLDGFIGRIRAFDHADANFFADQLVTIRRFFGISLSP